MFMCRQTGNLWCKLIQKGREKKEWGNISADNSQACEALVYYKSVIPALSENMKGCKVSNFKERRDGDYVGTYVFYTLTHPDGKQEQKHIAIRNDNEKHIWVADGGL